MERNTRKTYTGKVVSIKEEKTIKVLVQTHRKHAIYGKRVEYSKKFTAHDEKNDAKMGDIVEIMETRPLSKTKRYTLVKIIERAVQL
jgi:small subunit ribosomal protein S17